jgi:hypothetical protein
LLIKRRAVGSSAVPGSHGFGDQVIADPRTGLVRQPFAGVEMAVTASSSDQVRHLALFYHSRGEYLAALAGFIQASQARGDAVFVAVPQGNAQLVHQELWCQVSARGLG